MPAHDLYHGLKVFNGTHAVAVGTTGTGQASKIIDRAGHSNSDLLWLIDYGAITATDAVFTVLMKEGDVTGTLTSVADIDMLGTEAAAGIAAGTPRTSGSDKNVTKKLGYIGAKRYCEVTVSSTITAGTPVALIPIAVPSSRPAAVP
jgi:hypothetical protein